MSFVDLDGADITDSGAVLLGEFVVCDSHHPRPVRIISHAHSDHMLQMDESINYCKSVIATPVTRDIIGVLRGEDTDNHITPLDYEKTFEYEGESIVLYPACHVPGSAQVLLENRERQKILYTGDFRYPAG